MRRYDFLRRPHVARIDRPCLVLDRPTIGIEVPLDVLDILDTAPHYILVIGSTGAEGLFDAVTVEGGERLGGVKGVDEQDGHSRKLHHSIS
jgi:hypothetical protein